MAGRSPYCHVSLHFLPLAGHNLLLAYYQSEDIYLVLYYAWVQVLLQMGPLLHLGAVITLVPSTPDYMSSALTARPCCFHSIVCVLLGASCIKLTARSNRKRPALKERVSELNGKY